MRILILAGLLLLPAVALAHNIDDPDNCGGRSRSFIEGCIAFAEGR